MKPNSDQEPMKPNPEITTRARGNSSSSMGDNNTVGGAGTNSDQISDIVLEYILAGIPFPHILKVRELSKNWENKFFLVARHACDFTNFPLQFLAFYDQREHQIHGFDPVMKIRRRIHAVSTSTGNCTAIGCGALMVLVELNSQRPIADVMNLLTRHTRRLDYPVERFLLRFPATFFEPPVLVPCGANGYELFIWFRNFNTTMNNNINFMVYRSNTGTWITRSYELHDDLGYFNLTAYIDGKTYWICPSQDTLVQLNVENGVRRTALLGPENNNLYMPVSNRFLVRCGSCIMLGVVNFYLKHFIVIISRLDPDSLAILEVSRFTKWGKAKSSVRNKQLNSRATASENRVYIYCNACLIIYDVQHDTWRVRVNIPGKIRWNVRDLFAFQPSINSYILP